MTSEAFIMSPEVFIVRRFDRLMHRCLADRLTSIKADRWLQRSSGISCRIFSKRESAYGNVVFDRTDTCSRPSGVFDGVSLIPGVHLALEEDTIIVPDRDANTFRLDFRVPFQSIFDLVLDVLGFGVRPDLDVIQDSPYPGKLPDILLGRFLLVMPVSFS